MSICWSMPTFQRNILSPSSRAEVTTQGNREPTVMFQGGTWVASGLREGNGPFQGSLECTVFLFGAGSLLVCIAVPYSFPLIDTLLSVLALLVLYKLPISLPCHFSPGRWRQYVSPKRRHRPTYQHGTKTQKLKKIKKNTIITVRILNLI
jgi:hypothetical protein